MHKLTFYLILHDPPYLTSSEPNKSMNTSVINMKVAANESKKNIGYLDSAMKSEAAKIKVLETESLMKFISNSDVFLLFSVTEQNQSITIINPYPA